MRRSLIFVHLCCVRSKQFSGGGGGGGGGSFVFSAERRCNSIVHARQSSLASSRQLLLLLLLYAPFSVRSMAVDFFGGVAESDIIVAQLISN
jgi:hypothetical protein